MSGKGSSETVDNSKQKYAFQKVELFKNETIGIGSFGAVCKAKCDQLVCAAKVLHPFVFQMQPFDSDKEHRQPFNRFEKECKFLSCVNHPNIVQYLGTYRDPETNAPVLLMELMDESLTHFLESSPGDIPCHIQVNIAMNIAQALAFLHVNGIIHRDLSSNNVLLIAGSRAKVSDFGMSKFNESSLATMTQCPGTLVFMSPEALDQSPVYTEKLDNFSFGVLLIQIVTKKFPAPSEQFVTELIPDRQNPEHMVKAKVPVPEVERRQTHIGLVELSHPLLPIALECLKDEPIERPSSQQICHFLDDIQKSTEFKDSLPTNQRACVSTKIEQIEELSQILQAKDEILQEYIKNTHSKEEEVKRLEASLYISRQRTEGLQHENQELQDRFEAQEHQLQRLRARKSSESSSVSCKDSPKRSSSDSDSIFSERLSPSRAHSADSGRSPGRSRHAGRPGRARYADRVFSPLRHPHLIKSDDSQVSDSPLCHEEIKQTQRLAERYKNYMVLKPSDSPYGNLHAGSSVVIGGAAYFTSGTKTIHKFVLVEGQWGKLPECSLTEYTIVAVNDVLTTVGGMHMNWRNIPKHSNKLFCYSKKKWTEPYPLMPTCRSYPGAVYANKYLVVVGGFNLTSGTLTTVEILDTVESQWFNVSLLPFKTSQPSVAIFKESIYLHAGYTPSEQESISVVKCSLRDLVQSSAAWKRVASLELSKSSLVVANGHLLAVGGETSNGDCTELVHQYDIGCDRWEAVGLMCNARCKCLTALLPGNKLVVVGGDSEKETKFEVATFTF